MTDLRQEFEHAKANRKTTQPKPKVIETAVKPEPHPVRNIVKEIEKDNVSTTDEKSPRKSQDEPDRKLNLVYKTSGEELSIEKEKVSSH